MFVILRGREDKSEVVKQLILSKREELNSNKGINYVLTRMMGKLDESQMDKICDSHVVLHGIFFYHEIYGSTMWYERPKTESELMKEAVGDLFD